MWLAAAANSDKWPKCAYRLVPSSIGTMNSTGSSSVALRREHRAAGLQVAPAQRTVDAVENEHHALLDRSTRTSMKLWKNGAWLKSNTPDNASTLNGQALNHLIQYQNGCFHSGISASILARRRSVLG